jgi:hypothetical protein
MENLKWREDPVIEEIQAIREEISKITAGFSDEELLAWYRREAQDALSQATRSKSVSKEAPTNVDDDPVIEEIRAIREENARRTEGLTDEERLSWYNSQARRPE